MTERPVCNNFMPSDPGSSTGERGIICAPYRAPGFANFSATDISLARSYFPTVEGPLLPETATENSRARACGHPPEVHIARDPVRVVEQPFSEIFTSTVCGKYFLAKVNA